MIRPLVHRRIFEILRSYRRSNKLISYGMEVTSLQHVVPNAAILKRYANIFYFGLLGYAYSFVAHCEGDAKLLPLLTPSKIVLIIHESDDYFQSGKFQECYDLLYPYRSLKNPDLLWRLARVRYNQSKESSVTKKQLSDYIEEAYLYIEEAVSLTENNAYVHRWMAVLVDAKAQLEGIKSRIEHLPQFKQHLALAVKLNPRDATSIYMLGQYCYEIADMPWFQRQIASTLFAKPPVATFEEALEYFQKAEEVEPNFYSMNLLMLGKTYLKLGKIEAARYWLKLAFNYPITTDEDANVRDEARGLLAKNPVPRKTKL